MAAVSRLARSETGLLLNKDSTSSTRRAQFNDLSLPSLWVSRLPSNNHPSSTHHPIPPISTPPLVHCAVNVRGSHMHSAMLHHHHNTPSKNPPTTHRPSWTSKLNNTTNINFSTHDDDGSTLAHNYTRPGVVRTPGPKFQALWRPSLENGTGLFTFRKKV